MEMVVILGHLHHNRPPVWLVVTQVSRARLLAIPRTRTTALVGVPSWNFLHNSDLYTLVLGRSPERM